MFKVNDKVVYPGYGVASIEEVIEKNVAGVAVSFFKLSFVFKDMTILVPLHNLGASGVRYLSGDKEVVEALDELLRTPERKLESLDFTPSGWNKRNKEYNSRIQSGKLLELIKIYRDIMHVARQKELSFGEKTLLNTTEDLIAQELITIRGCERDDIVQALREPFRQFFPIGGFVNEAPLSMS